MKVHIQTQRMFAEWVNEWMNTLQHHSGHYPQKEFPPETCEKNDFLGGTFTFVSNNAIKNQNK